ncbi:MAG: helix-turn-helix transcriptional regulator [Saprospiraceae bacterium]
MGISVRKIIEQLPKERQNKIKKESKILIQQYRSLQEFRQSTGITQEELAAELLQTQVNISKLENKNDMLLSTLRNYAQALGCRLEIRLVGKDNKSILIENLQ